MTARIAGAPSWGRYDAAALAALNIASIPELVPSCRASRRIAQWIVHDEVVAGRTRARGFSARRRDPSVTASIADICRNLTRTKCFLAL